MGLLYPWCNLQLDCQTAGVFVGGDNTVRSEDDRESIATFTEQVSAIIKGRILFNRGGGGEGKCLVPNF